MTSEKTEPPQPTLQHRHLWIDAGAGVAGDMLLGALVDAGAPIGTIESAIEAVIPHTVRLVVGEVRRGGLRATKVDVEKVAADLPHRHWVDIRAMLVDAGVDLDPVTRERALAVFAHLADAEARAHGIEVQDVHFHEVGAWDSIADVVGVCAGLTALGVTSISASPVALGSGTVRTDHGVLPVPAPAVLELSRGWRVLTGGEGELATPTGMALITALAGVCEELPPLAISGVGIGAGTRDPGGRSNVVRAVLGAPVSAAGDVRSVPDGDATGTSDAVVLEANVDDLDPRVWPGVLAALLEAGAADAWLIPILMKKGRPAHTLAVLASVERVPHLRERIFVLVPTLGVRETAVRKSVLERTWREVEVDGAMLRIKVGHRGGVILTATPEFDDVARVAAERGDGVRDVLSRAVAAAVAAGLTPGSPAPG